jgi:hypothetical protein
MDREEGPSGHPMELARFDFVGMERDAHHYAVDLFYSAIRPRKRAPPLCIRRGFPPGIYKRGEVYWYKFMWQGKLIRESTKKGNDKVARQMEAAHRTSLAKGEVGIREKRPAPTLKEFCECRFEPWAPGRLSSTPA